MADKAKFRAVILWEHEIRAAARALRALHDEKDEEKRGDRLREALQASIAALWNADDDNAALVLSRPTDFMAKAREGK